MIDGAGNRIGRKDQDEMRVALRQREIGSIRTYGKIPPLHPIQITAD